MKTTILLENKMVPVYFNAENTQPMSKLLRLLRRTIEHKVVNGKKMIKTCLDTVISIEVVGSEAILHTYRESDTLALSLY
ncbi:hypothetical protein PO903_14780 [Paenibacillus sp. PK4536]|uniref:Uncharacterized protein n=1 Tax=Paenibacillus nuruki TaxID=1886670 RepID=A0A1E3L8M3_9BACL|nr:MULTISPECIES: hypothetical protein [Paenibacillus]ODP30167.1 hypothetical protein PTI45_00409 [Paenibacillus nuruki]TKJ91675.1 hypothetical protein PaeCFBP13512_10110 [Paenibacillus sp. CFBP13512]WIM37910.1 hypothetical protein PO903_14780 [Paenibacillus sp. PK4536]CAJ1315430.1 3-dehydroquinate dehydratase [Paenibacillus nuruki]